MDAHAVAVIAIQISLRLCILIRLLNIDLAWIVQLKSPLGTHQNLLILAANYRVESQREVICLWVLDRNAVY